MIDKIREKYISPEIDDQHLRIFVDYYGDPKAKKDEEFFELLSFFID